MQGQDTPRVSVITAAYNAEKYIGTGITSVMNQTYPNWELWVVDDCSTDHTGAIARAYAQKHPNVHYLKTAYNTGAPAAPRNMALRKMTGRYAAFMDGDDYFMPEKLEAQVAFMQEKDCAISYTAYRRVDGTGEKIGALKRVPEKLDYKSYLGNTCITMCSAMVDTEKTGMIRFDETVPRGRDDLVLWIELLKQKHEAFGLNKDLTRFRQGHGSISGNFTEMAKSNWAVYQKYAADLNIVDRLAAFVSYGFHAIEKRLIF